jgi:hypothetical protein
MSVLLGCDLACTVLTSLIYLPYHKKYIILLSYSFHGAEFVCWSHISQVFVCAAGSLHFKNFGVSIDFTKSLENPICIQLSPDL